MANIARRVATGATATAAIALLSVFCSAKAASNSVLEQCIGQQQVAIAPQRPWQCRLDAIEQQARLVRARVVPVDASVSWTPDGGTEVTVSSPLARSGQELLWIAPGRSGVVTVNPTDPHARPATFALEVEPRLVSNAALVSLSDSGRPDAIADSTGAANTISQLQQATNTFRQTGETDLAAEAQLRISAICYWTTGDWACAANSAHKAIQWFTEVGDSINAARAMASRGMALLESARSPGDGRVGPGSRSSEYYEAQQLLESAAAQFESAGLLADQAYALNDVGLGFFYQGMADQARTHYASALVQFRRARDVTGELLSLENMAVLDYDAGNFVDAADEFRELLQRPASSTDLDGRVSLLNNYAAASVATGRYDEALSALLTALPLTEDDVNPAHRAMTLHQLGRVYQILGDSERSGVLLRDALALRRLEGTGDRRGLLTSLLRVGDFERDHNRMDSALKLHLEAFDHAVSAAEKARCLLAVGTDQLTAGNLSAAEATFARALALDLGERWPIRTSLLARQGEARMLRGDPSGRAGLLAAAQAHERRDAYDLAARDFTIVAANDFRNGQIDSALASARRAASLYDSDRLAAVNPDLRAVFVAGRADTYELMASIYMEMSGKARTITDRERLGWEAFMTAETLRMDALQDFQELAAAPVGGGTIDDGEISRLDTRIAGKRLRLATVLEQQNPSPQRVEALENEIALLRSQLDEAQRRGVPEHPIARQPRASAEAMRRGLASDEIVMSWMPGESASWVWCLTNHRTEWFALPSRRELEQAAAGLRSLWSKPATQDVRRERELSGVLLGDASTCLQRATRVTVVSGEPLRGVPIGALWVKDANGTSRRIIESHQVSYRPAVARWQRAEARRSDPGDRSILLVGDPVLADGLATAASATRRIAGGVQFTRRFAELPGAASELAQIAQMTEGWRQVSLVRERANRSTLLAEPLDDFRVIHFATHALLDVHDPQFSALILSGDTSLTLRDVMNLHLDTDIVVMGACEASLGKPYRGQLSFGLSEAFLFAGADNVVGSLWPVADRSTERFMRVFYEHYLSVGVTAPMAVQAAATAMMKDARYSHPFYWAAFINLTGS